MKSTFSRTFTAAAAILVLTLLTLGASFQALVKEYLEDTTISGLKNDARVIADLAAAYSMDGSLSGQEFLLNLDVASRVSDADAVICDARGRVILCSDALLGCEHQGWVISSPAYLSKVWEEGCVMSTGFVQGLYTDARYVVAMPFAPSAATSPVGYVIVPHHPDHGCTGSDLGHLSHYLSSGGPHCRGDHDHLCPPDQRPSAGYGPDCQRLRSR